MEVNPEQKTVLLDTPQGILQIRSFCTPEQIQMLSFEETRNPQGSYTPLVSRKERLCKTVAQPDANVTLATLQRGKIVGVGLLESPEPDDRWNKVGERIMMEVTIVEVNREWRHIGVAQNILHVLMDHSMAEHRIYYMVGYSWTWDLDHHGGGAMDYRNTLIQLFSREGFKSFQTNEPNIMLRPENLFMARIGAGVPEETVQRFKLARFNLL